MPGQGHHHTATNFSTGVTDQADCDRDGTIVVEMPQRDKRIAQNFRVLATSGFSLNQLLKGVEALAAKDAA